MAILGTATVHNDNRIIFQFNNVTDIEVGVEYTLFLLWLKVLFLCVIIWLVNRNFIVEGI